MQLKKETVCEPEIEILLLSVDVLSESMSVRIDLQSIASLRAVLSVIALLASLFTSLISDLILIASLTIFFFVFQLSPIDAVLLETISSTARIVVSPSVECLI